MEHIINLHIEHLPEGSDLAASDDVLGLVAQGRTVTETLKIARDVAEKLIEAQSERAGALRLTELRETLHFSLVLS